LLAALLCSANQIRCIHLYPTKRHLPSPYAHYKGDFRQINFFSEKPKTYARQARRLKSVEKYSFFEMYSTTSTTAVVDQNRAIIVEK
jgi:hypothetical protein